MRHRDRAVQAYRRASQRQLDGFRAEIHEGCPLEDLALPKRRPILMREAINLVMDSEKPSKLRERDPVDNCPLGYFVTDELTKDESALVHEKAFQCIQRRLDGRCVLMNCVAIETGAL